MLQQIRILIADDEPDILRMLKTLFERKSYLVITAENGTVALQKASEHPDLILLDINMPDVDGIEVCRRIRDFVSYPILFLTARADNADKLRGLAIGGYDYIVKPFSIIRLLSRAFFKYCNRQTQAHLVKPLLIC